MPRTYLRSIGDPVRYSFGRTTPVWPKIIKAVPTQPLKKSKIQESSMHERIGTIGERGTYATSAATILASMTIEHWAVIVGIVCTIIVAAVTCYCKLRWIRIIEAKAAADKLDLDDDPE